MKIGLIGCGAVSGYGHLPAIHGSQDWELAGIADKDPVRLEEIRGKYNVEFATTDYKALLGVDGLDAVVVATHLDTHCGIAMDALARGIHVLCEKPMATSTDECRRMADAARDHECILAVNFNTRCGPVYRRIKELIDEGAVGAVRVVRIVYNWSCHQWKPPERLETFMAGGGPLLDSAVHFFDGVRWYTGQEFARIDANGLILPPYENPQHGIASCLMDGGSIALVEAGWTYTKRTKDAGSFYQISVIGDDGTLEHDTTSGILRIWTMSETREEPIADRGKHFEITYDAFARSIRHGTCMDLASGHDGLKATEAALAALASAKSGAGRPNPGVERTDRD
ncbi:MAG: Gfo/Idh/MocA family protein [Planctomycetota bacterium]